MDRIRCRLVIRLMAAVAICRQRRVIVIYVAARAGYLSVKAGQGKDRRAVVEFSVGPERCVVAQITSRRETQLLMVNWGESITVIIEMAGHACRAG
jgi:hypothetical protein